MEEPFASSDLTGTEDWDSPADTASADDWTISGRGSIDEMARTLSTFGTRLDALVTSTTSYRAAITDRLVEYADMVSRLVKNQSTDLAEHRSSNQHLLAELQSGITSSEAAISSLASRVEGLMGSSPSDESREVLSEIRSILDAQERLGQFLTDALDQFGDRVVERLDQMDTTAAGPDLSGALIAVQESDIAIEESIRSLGTDLSAMRDDLVNLASGDVVGALWDEVRALRSLVDDMGRERRPVGFDPAPRMVAALDDVRRDIADLRSDLSEGLTVEADDELSAHLDEIRTRLELGDTAPQSHAAAAVDGEGEGEDGRADEILAAVGDMTSSVEAIRSALSTGVDARPTPELSDRLERIGSTVDGLGERLDAIAAGSQVVRWDATSTVTTPSAVSADVDALIDEVAKTRADIAAVAARLDHGLEIDLDDDVADRVAALRDEVAAEFEALRMMLADRRDVPSAPAAVSDTGPDVRAAVADALDGMPEAVAAELKSELVALRRRIKVRSEADVLTDDQLDRIAEAVADRLG